MLNINEQIFQQIKAARSILIAFPATWENDNVFAALALYSVLKKLEKNVQIAAQKTNKDLGAFSFIPNIQEIKNNLDHLRRFIVSLDISKTKVSQIKYVVEENKLNFIVSPENGWFEPQDVSSRVSEFKHDLILIVGANDLESLGSIYDENIEFFYKTSIINLNCSPGTEEFGQINYIDLNCAAVSELIYKLLKKWSEITFDENLATIILAGIISKTKNFKISNLSPETLLISSQLISAGAKREEIINRFYRARQINDLKIWGKILNNLRLEANGELIVSYLQTDDLIDVKLNEDTLRDIIEELITNLPKALIALILVEDEKGTNFFLFSLKNINIIEFANRYKLLGNIKSAQGFFEKKLLPTDKELTEYLTSRLDKIK